MAKNMSASSNGRNSGFLGYLKGLFRTRGNAVAEASCGDTELLVAASAPPPAAIEPAPIAAEPVPTSPDAGAVPSIAIPLQSVLNTLPTELRSKVRSQTAGRETVSVSLDKILSQLGQGLVYIPFGDIRSAAPHVFAPGSENDQVPVALPLNEILSRINPALLIRRTSQRQVEIPAEISSPFDTKGQALSISVGNAQSVTPAAPRKPAPGLDRPVRGSISSVNTPALPPAATSPARTPSPLTAPIPFAFQKQQPQPAAAATSPARTPSPLTAPIPFAFQKQQPQPAAAPANPPPASAPAQFRSPSPAQVRPASQPRPQSQSGATSQASSLQPAGPVISLPLSVLSDNWPDGLQREIAQNRMADARVDLPVDFIEAALKRGRVVFPWKQLRSWIRPAVPPEVSVHDAAELELPIKVIAPLFIARKQSAQPHAKADVDATIPNLFFGFPQPEAAAPAVPAIPAAAVVPVTLPSPPEPVTAGFAPASPIPLGVVSAPKPEDTNYYIWDDLSDTTRIHAEEIQRKGPASTEFASRYSSPNEIVSRAAALGGVTGALIALPDGLMVASRIPPDQNGDTLAAFLPQIFAKVSQCTRELRLGELNNLNFTVGNVPWKIFRVNAIFFAAFGNAAQALPTAQLAALAAELDRKNR
jgi:predicted regulator of Ras-like GTPase activity (Roadblock/LC7/MglB family)